MKSKLSRFLLMAVLSLVALAFLLFTWPEESPLAGQPHFREMLQRLDTLSLEPQPATAPLSAGWAKVNITPAEALPMAGYTPRYAFTAVEDSLFARTLLLDNGSATVAMVSLDLLMFPPEVHSRVQALLQERHSGVFLYAAATHTHNGPGAFDSSLAAQVSMGRFSEDFVEELAEKVLQSIDQAMQNRQPARAEWYTADASAWIVNRLDKGSPADGLVRGLKIRRADGSSACLGIYSAHPTNLPMRSTYLSRDYPGELVDYLEANGFDFSLFMAGMVGSHNLKGVEGHDLVLARNAGQLLGKVVCSSASGFSLPDSVAMLTARIPLPMPEPALRFNHWLALRPWVFNSVFGELKGEITLLQLGPVVFAGLPADFSGELYLRHLSGQASQSGLQLAITGFNGGYVGYIVDKSHFSNSTKEEVTTMNWLGANGGEYLVAVLNRLLENVAVEEDGY